MSKDVRTHGLPPKMPVWAKLLGARYWHGDGTTRTKIGEISTRNHVIALKAVFYGDMTDSDRPSLMIGVWLFTWFAPLPKWTRWFFRHGPSECWSLDKPQFGFSSSEEGMHLYWGRRSTLMWWPWTREHIRTEYLGTDFEWHDDRAHPEKVWARSHPNPAHRYTGSVGPAPWSETHPYRYLLRNGQVQIVDATITRRRAFYGKRWIGPLRMQIAIRNALPKEMFDNIDIQFSDEVGERAGSWKGGCVGCSFDIRPDESPKAALKRMEAERVFR
ncbi:MAG: hypothetical protein VYD90_10420 [Pseudomonadota bacterium]|nr:hypothetical protein [Pseudomonadota bacterium]